jgi:3-oxoacyl-[acyl-carrier-protein] synthase III
MCIFCKTERRDHTPIVRAGAAAAVKPKSAAVVGAAETTRLGVIPDMSEIGLHADAALNALADARLKAADIDGVATAGISPTDLAYYLGITPTWVDGTNVGGC